MYEHPCPVPMAFSLNVEAYHHVQMVQQFGWKCLICSIEAKDQMGLEEHITEPSSIFDRCKLPLKSFGGRVRLHSFLSDKQVTLSR